MNLGNIHLDAQILRTIFLVIFIVLVFGARLTKGTAKETPSGLEFGMKPVVFITRLLILPIYFGIIFYPIITHQHNMPIWVPIIMGLLFIFVLYQSPATILLTPTAVLQKFWFRADKTIQYPEVMTIQTLQGGNITRVLGDNRTNITHSSSHSAAETFRTELERRTGKKTLA
jgi:hypothetical protein